MSDTDHQSLQPGDERAYEAMALAVQTNVAWLLTPFKSESVEVRLLRPDSAESFLLKFFYRVEDFIERCCRDYAEIMRQCALVPEIRGTPSGLLAQQIRQDVFRPVDAWLDDGNKFRRVYAEKKQRLSPQIIARFSEETKALIWMLIMGCLKAVGQQPERLRDYAAAKCFGVQVSLERQQMAWKAVEGTISKELEAAIRLPRALLEAVEKEAEEADQEAELRDEEEEKAAFSKLEGLRRRVRAEPVNASRVRIVAKAIGRIIFAVLAAVAGLLGVCCFGAVLQHSSDGNSGEAGRLFGLGLVLTVIAVVSWLLVRLLEPEKPLAEQIAELEQRLDG